jgi:hypothetical protein
MNRFLEKYHPDVSGTLKKEISNRRREFMETFLQKLQDGAYDNVCFDVVGSVSNEIVETAAALPEEKEEKEHKVDEETGEEIEDNMVIEEDRETSAIPADVLDQVAPLVQELESEGKCCLFLTYVKEDIKREDILKVYYTFNISFFF